MARKDKLSTLIRDEWPTRLDAEFEKRFWCKITTRWNIYANNLVGAYETTREDGEPLTPEQMAFITGYMLALTHVYIWNGRV